MTTPRGTTPGDTGQGAPGSPAAPRPGDGQHDQEGGPRPAGPTPGVVPRAGTAGDPGPRRPASPENGPGWSAGARPRPEDAPTTTVLPAGARPARQVPARPAAPGARPVAGRTRRARLSLRRIDPWSVFVFSLVAAVFLGIALVVAVAVLYAVLGSLGVTGSLNQLVAEVTGGNATTEPLLTGGRIIGGAAVLAAVNIVLLTLLATLGALLYNVCASFTGGLELTFGERD